MKSQNNTQQPQRAPCKITIGEGRYQNRRGSYVVVKKDENGFYDDFHGTRFNVNGETLPGNETPLDIVKRVDPPKF